MYGEGIVRTSYSDNDDGCEVTNEVPFGASDYGRLLDKLGESRMENELIQIRT